MIAIPAVDVRDRVCAQLEGPEHADDRAQFGEPLAIVRTWVDAGFRRIHVADLDAAAGRGSNTSTIDEILRDHPSRIQASGGVDTADRIEQLVNAGAARIVLGARALEEVDWLADQTANYPGLLLVATAVRNRRVSTRGWVRTLPMDILELVGELSGLQLGGLIVSAMHLTGEMRGPDLALMEDVAAAAAFPIVAAGGIATMADLRALENRGMGGAVIGTALYNGALDARMVAGEFTE